jgi:hypothetical protein
MPPFCQKFDNKALSAGEWQEAFTCLKSNNLMLDYAVIENKNKENWEIRKNYILNKTNKTTQEIKDNYSGLLKKNLKRANSELSLDIEFSHTAMETFLSSLPLFQSLVLDKFAHVFWKLKRTHLKFYYAIDVNTNQALATLMYVKYSKKAYLLFPYTSEEGKKRQAMSFLRALILILLLIFMLSLALSNRNIGQFIGKSLFFHIGNSFLANYGYLCTPIFLEWVLTIFFNP